MINNKEYNILLDACQEGNLDKVKKYLTPEFVNGSVDWTPPLYISVTCNKYNVADYLINKGANVNNILYEGMYGYLTTFIHMLIDAMYTGYSDGFSKELETESIEYLIKKGADINKTDENRNTPLDWAVQYHHEPAEKLLKELGAKHSWSFLIFRYNRYKKNEAINEIDYIELNYVDKKEVNKLSNLFYHLEVLFSSIWFKNKLSSKLETKILDDLINNFIYQKDINELDYKGRTPLDFAIELDHEPAMELLISNGAKKANEIDGNL